jgi:lysophospholipase L1-like esterase
MDFGLPWSRNRVSRVHTFEDSHSRFGFEKIEANGQPIIVHHIGPKLMHTVGRDGLNSLEIHRANIKKTDAVIFCFGEIDCRCHVGKRAATYSQNVASTVDKYLNSISIYKAENPHVRIAVFNVPPPAAQSMVAENPEFPFVGPDRDRVTYTVEMNGRLKANCDKLGLAFIDVVDDYSDQNGRLRHDLSDGTVHIDNPDFIITALRFHLSNGGFVFARKPMHDRQPIVRRVSQKLKALKKMACHKKA